MRTCEALVETGTYCTNNGGVLLRQCGKKAVWVERDEQGRFKPGGLAYCPEHVTSGREVEVDRLHKTGRA